MDTKTLLDLVKTLGPGLFVILVLGLAVTVFGSVFGFLYFFFRRSASEIDIGKGWVRITRVDSFADSSNFLTERPRTTRPRN